MLKPARPCRSTSTSAAAMIRSRVSGAACVDLGRRTRRAAAPGRGARPGVVAEGAVRRVMLAILQRKEIVLQTTYGVRHSRQRRRTEEGMDTVDIIGLLV